MSKAIENARKRLANLRKEAQEIEHFIKMYEQFEDGVEQMNAVTSSELGGKVSRIDLPVDNFSGKPRRTGSKPDEIAQTMERVIREVGQPMTRGEIVAALERREMEIPALDKQRYVGTLAWRHKGTFLNVQGRGYWLRNEPMPPPPKAPPPPDFDDYPSSMFDKSDQDA